MSTTAPGVLIGQGRECDVFDIGAGRVLRRSRLGRSGETEALTMQHLHRHGYPVPQVFDVDGGDIVMQRIHGRTMLQAFGRTPWKLRSWAVLLAELIDQLSAIPVPSHALVSRFGSGDTLTHGDLHPMNVMLTERGPVVIDWADASVAGAGMEAAVTWITMAGGEIEGPLPVRVMGGVARDFLVGCYAQALDQSQARPHLRAAFDYKAAGKNTRPSEIDRMKRYLASLGLSDAQG